jgi:hypothetical protein
MQADAGTAILLFFFIIGLGTLCFALTNTRKKKITWKKMK